MRLSLIACLLATLGAWLSAGDAPLRVCVTVPDLGCLARAVGGDEVAVTVFVKGEEDPHFIEARPSFVKQLADADLFIQSGLELEVGWVPVLLKNARNDRVLSGAPGFLDAGAAISPLGIPAGEVDRSQGDVHAAGNPHYLSDPLSALRVVATIRERLSALRPERAAAFRQRADDFIRRLGDHLEGAELAAKYDTAKLALLIERGKLDAFLRTQGDEAKLAGWLGQMRPFAGRKVIADHDLWPYFARTFAIEVVGFLEPKPGVPPTTRHLAGVIALIKAQSVGAILTVPFFDPRHARFVAEQSGARIASMAHQSGALPGTDEYLAFVDHNVAQLVAALKGTP